MANFNKILLMGNLTRDPELKYAPSNKAVVNFGLAVNRKWKDQDGTEKQETCFVECVAFTNAANAINKYVHKGDPIFVEGRLHLDSWLSDDGTKRSKLKVIIQSVQFLGRNKQEKVQQPAEGTDQDIPF